MVLIHVKSEAEEKQFLYECPGSSSIDEIAEAVVEIFSLQSKIQSLSLLLRQRFLTNSLQERYPDAALALNRTLTEAETYASKDQVLIKRLLSPHVLRDHVKSIEKEVKIAHSMGLADSNLLQLFSEFLDHEPHEGMQLWWAGKELVRGKGLCDYIGGNEKTKVVVFHLGPVWESTKINRRMWR